MQAQPSKIVNSLGFFKPEAQTRVVVAMSGGVDSSVCAAMLAREGYEVIGVTLQLYDHGAAIQKAKACCAGQDIYDAKRVAEMMGFPHYVLDYESNFKEQVIEDFADTYLKGATPIPCVRCNQTVKFKDLLTVAKDLGADCMATGHYIRRVEGPNGPELHRGADGGKDQSYFLFATTRAQLDFLRFPLGGMEKSETRRLAVELGLNDGQTFGWRRLCRSRRQSLLPSSQSTARRSRSKFPRPRCPRENYPLRPRPITGHEPHRRKSLCQMARRAGGG